ncbi:ribosome-associated translation inhibitor RaiA [Candidatus Saccharibacteria bacterium]|nr:ribosome-associated translation inhibitor RaiA [Candidatus Saccharibacteria bacterium]
MIKTIQIDGVHTKLNKDLELYVHKKIGTLDRFTSRKSRESVKADVKLKEAKGKDKSKRFTCEVIVRLPKERITVHEKASSFLEAIDLSEDKLKTRLKKYKEKHGDPKLHRRIINRLKNSR